jgi:hypothetical protein
VKYPPSSFPSVSSASSSSPSGSAHPPVSSISCLENSFKRRKPAAAHLEDDGKSAEEARPDNEGADDEDEKDEEADPEESATSVEHKKKSIPPVIYSGELADEGEPGHARSEQEQALLEELLRKKKLGCWIPIDVVSIQQYFLIGVCLRCT